MPLTVAFGQTIALSVSYKAELSDRVLLRSAGINLTLGLIYIKENINFLACLEKPHH
jgi:hypothetical protein